MQAVIFNIRELPSCMEAIRSESKTVSVVTDRVVPRKARIVSSRPNDLICFFHHALSYPWTTWSISLPPPCSELYTITILNTILHPSTGSLQLTKHLTSVQPIHMGEWRDRFAGCCRNVGIFCPVGIRFHRHISDLQNVHIVNSSQRWNPVLVCVSQTIDPSIPISQINIESTSLHLSLLLHPILAHPYASGFIIPWHSGLFSYGKPA